MSEAAEQVRASACVDGPDFICIGAQKGGTRWLYDQLEQHRDFWMPPVKELHYFNQELTIDKARKLLRPLRKDAAAANERLARKSRRSLDEQDARWLRRYIRLRSEPYDLSRYAELFTPKGTRLSGDITPPYAVLEHAHARAIRARFPAARIIYLAREPIDRFWSQYCMAARRDKIEHPEQFTAFERFLERRGGQRLSAVTSAVDTWRLGEDDPAFGLFFFDDLKADAEGLRGHILTFLGADASQPTAVVPPDFNRKVALPKIAMSAQVRDCLIELFRDEIHACATRFRGAATEWPGRYGL